MPPISSGTEVPHITSVRFLSYKAFSDFSLSVDRFNILVGPNNAGKSTVLGAFRILSEAIRKARSKSPTFVQGPDGSTLGYEVSLSNVPVATENVFHDYDESRPPSVTFRLSNGEKLILFFPQPGVCNLICDTVGKAVKTAAAFRQRFNLEIGFVPILGPVEHNEPLYQKEAAREALLSHTASRNFRNIWFHYPEHFEEFRTLVTGTWPGMDIKQPEVDSSHDKTLLRMFCPEDRIDREIFWAGFGFQVWCQMLTYMVSNRSSSLFIIDEPDIYLHSDLQRQLVSVLRTLGPDILVATHSTEILLEAETDEILSVNKVARSAKRLADPSQIRQIFELLGSNAKLTLTQIAKAGKLLFVEGKDFAVISLFAARLGATRVASRSAFAVIPAKGFNTTRVKNFQDGVEATTGTAVGVAIIFDRDYRSDEEVEAILKEMQEHSSYAHIHSRKELENFLLSPKALTAAANRRIWERSRRTGVALTPIDTLEPLLFEIIEDFKIDIQAQYLSRHRFRKSAKPVLDETSVTKGLLLKFEKAWQMVEGRLSLVPGKDVLSKLNTQLQERWSITISPNQIIELMEESEIPTEMKNIILSLETFSRA